jgi:hypothetical protein
MAAPGWKLVVICIVPCWLRQRPVAEVILTVQSFLRYLVIVEVDSETKKDREENPLFSSRYCMAVG